MFGHTNLYGSMSDHLETENTALPLPTSSRRRIMVSLRKMAEQDTGAVLQLEIKEEQPGYVSPIEQILARGEPSRDDHLLEMGGEMIGFFIIDHAYPQTYAFAQPGDMGLLAYVVDAKQQGKGVGTAGVKALSADLQDQYPTARAVVLTVHGNNVLVIQSDVQGGVEDTQQL
jgi:RimJ/RimL family protein N-acetyltransferase